MELEEIELTTREINKLKKKGINNLKELTRMIPTKYIDYRTPKNLTNAVDSEKCSMIVIIMEIKQNSKFIELKCREKETRNQVSIKWFNQEYRYAEVYNLKNLEAAVCGTFTRTNWGPGFNNPDIFTTDVKSALCIYPVYSKISGIADRTLKNIVDKGLKMYNEPDEFDEATKRTFNIISETEMLKNLHHPKDEESLNIAGRRLRFERLYHFADRILSESAGIQKKSSFVPVSLTNCNKLIKALPYELTDDQKNIVSTFVKHARDEKRINALIQGDVASGKTLCAFLLMVAMSDNGYQSALIAPTGILAKQHYEELKKYVEPMGLTVVFLSGEIKAKEKREILKKIKDGSANFIVGTHSVISDAVEFKNLGLTVVDEEHKFGVIQKEKLKNKASAGVHNISMSATPIPRTLAMTLYGDAMDIYTIKTMPKGRKPVKTTISNDTLAIFRFMEQEIRNGHQCYVVCPLIENDETAEEGNLPESVDSVIEKIKDYFDPKGIKAVAITGKMKEDEKNQIIEQYSRNESQILVATTIIEVGVNVPNATVMVIMNAERFGLAGLHQLRGRVGRGNLQSYCILKSQELNNPRLEIMCKTTNGFEIAEEDLNLRGTGEFIGIKQSGDDKDVWLMLTYPRSYQNIKDYIKKRRNLE